MHQLLSLPLPTPSLEPLEAVGALHMRKGAPSCRSQRWNLRAPTASTCLLAPSRLCFDPAAAAARPGENERQPTLERHREAQRYTGSRKSTSSNAIGCSIQHHGSAAGRALHYCTRWSFVHCCQSAGKQHEPVVSTSGLAPLVP